MKTPLNKQRIIFYSFFTALLLRLLCLLNPAISSDHAIIGLAGMHITQGKFPLFFYGGHFEFVIEAYLAAVPFLLFGPSRFLLCLVPAVMSLIWIYAIYRLALRIFGLETALFSLLFASIAPVLFFASSVIPLEGYIETGILGAVCLLITYRIIYEQCQRSIWYFLLGLSLGFSLLMQFHIIPYALVIGYFLIVHDKKILFKRQWYILCAGGLIGAAPLIIYNLLHNWITWQEVGKGIEAGTLWGTVKNLIGHHYWVMFGAINENAAHQRIAVLDIFIMLVYAASFIHILVKKKRGSALLPAVFFVFIITYWLSGRGAANTRRYLVPLYSIVPIVLGYFIAELRQKQRIAAYSITAVLLCANLYFSLRSIPLFDRNELVHYNAARERDRQLFDFLAEQRVTGVYTYSWWISLKMNFDFKEKIIFTLIKGEPYPPYRQYVDRQENPAWVTHSLELIPSFAALGCTYDTYFIPNPVGEMPPYWVYYNIRKTPMTLEEIEPTDQWRARASHSPEKAAQAIDRIMPTYWCSGENQLCGMAFTLDLGRVHTDVTRLWFHPGPEHDWPSKYRLSASLDGRRWQTLAENSNFYQPLFWDGPHPFMRAVNGMIETDFPPQPVRFLRLELTAGGKFSPWSIAELYVYRKKSDKEPDWRPAELISRINELAVDKVFADPWVAGHIDSKQYTLAEHKPRFSTYTYDYYLVKLRKLNKYAFVVLAENYPSFVRQLPEVPFSTQAIGPYRLVAFAEDLAVDNYSSLYWDGFHLTACSAKETQPPGLPSGRSDSIDDKIYLTRSK